MRAGDIDVAASVEGPFRDHEPEAAGVRLEASDVQVHFLGQTVALPADLDELARRDKGPHVPLERRTLLGRHLEELQELADAGGMVDPLAHQHQDLI